MNTLRSMESELKQLVKKLEKYNDLINEKELSTMEKIDIEDQMRFMFQYKWQLEHRIRIKKER